MAILDDSKAGEEWSKVDKLPDVIKTFESGESMSVIVEVKLVDGSILRAHTWRFAEGVDVAWILDNDEPEDVTQHVEKWRHCAEQRAA
jgi:hypothetical protein